MSELPSGAPAESGLVAEYGVIGGSGFYDFFEDPERLSMSTPYGDPSDDLTIGSVAGHKVAFIARHGRGHRLPPHRVNYRANLWALRSVGVRRVLAPCAVGSLRVEAGPGTIVVPDQAVDRTWGREHTFYDVVGPVVHVDIADPYCLVLRRAAVTTATRAGVPTVDGGTLVVINGPRFSTRAESLMHQQAGWSIVGMTAMPEAALARELAMCFTTIALVTDYDTGVDGGEAVTHESVLAVFAQNVGRLKGVIADTVAELVGPDVTGQGDAAGSEERAAGGCRCRRALDGMQLPFELPGGP